MTTAAQPWAQRLISRLGDIDFPAQLLSALLRDLPRKVWSYPTFKRAHVPTFERSNVEPVHEPCPEPAEELRPEPAEGTLPWPR